MPRQQILKLIGVLVTLIMIAGCGYSYRSPLNTAATPDSTQVFVVKGKSYRCVKEDGTWRCEAIADAEARAKNSVFDTRNLDAKNQNPQHR